MTTDRLITGLWDEEPPGNARGSLHTCVSRLRRAVGEEYLVRSPVGYALAVDGCDVDLVHFADLLDSAADDERGEHAALVEALQLWQGPPFGQPPSEWLQRYEAPRLTELQLGAVERRITLDLEAGRYASCLSELDSYTGRYPLRETLWGLTLTALQGAGRRAEALARYEQLRQHLVEELGTDPSPEVQAIFQQLLMEEDPATVPRATRRVPRSLPRIASRFVGRKVQLLALDEALHAATEAGESLAVAIHGPGGVGKTALAVHWAQRMRDHFPDGLLFLDLRGFGNATPLRTEDVTDLLLERLGIAGMGGEVSAQHRLERLQDELADRRALLILDNVSDAEQVRPVLPSGDCGVLVTSRQQLRGLMTTEGLQRLTLEDMSVADAVTMLRTRLELSSTGDPSGEELEELATLCGRLPVALATVAERAGRSQLAMLSATISQLRDRRQRLRVLEGEADERDVSVRAVFDFSYHVLDEESRRLLPLLGLLESDCVCVPSAATLAGIEPAAAIQIIDRLVSASFLRDRGDGTYALHDLLQVYCRDLAERELADTEREDALKRLYTWYAHTGATSAEAVGAPSKYLDLPPLVEGIQPLNFDAAIEAKRWSVLHRWTLESHIRKMIEAGNPKWAAWIMLGLRPYFTMTGEARLRTELGQALADLAAETGDRFVESVARSELGIAAVHQQEFATALTAFARCEELCCDDGQSSTEVRLHAQINRGVAYQYAGDVQRALRMLDDVLNTAQRRGCGEQERLARVQLASALLANGEPSDAIEAAQIAAEEFARTQEWHRWGAALGLCARARQRLGEHDEAERLYRMVLINVDELGDVAKEVMALHELGLLQRETGRPQAARESWQRALQRMEYEGEWQMEAISRNDLHVLIDTPAPVA